MFHISTVQLLFPAWLVPVNTLANNGTGTCTVDRMTKTKSVKRSTKHRRATRRSMLGERRPRQQKRRPGSSTASSHTLEEEPEDSKHPSVREGVHRRVCIEK